MPELQRSAAILLHLRYPLKTSRGSNITLGFVFLLTLKKKHFQIGISYFSDVCTPRDNQSENQNMLS